jgi:hypothetical protein
LAFTNVGLMIADLGKVSTSTGDAKTLEPTHDDISNSIRAIAAINPSSTNGGSTSDVKPPELELAQEVGSQVASSAKSLGRGYGSCRTLARSSRE